MKKVFILLLCLFLVGCASTSNKLEMQISQLTETIQLKDKEINQLKNVLNEKNDQISKKEEKINELKGKLDMFGVFEK